MLLSIVLLVITLSFLKDFLPFKYLLFLIKIDLIITYQPVSILHSRFLSSPAPQFLTGHSCILLTESCQSLSGILLIALTAVPFDPKPFLLYALF